MNRRVWIWSIPLLVCICLISWPVSSMAQTSLGTVKGLIKDSSGAVIPSVNVTLQNQDNGQSRATNSTETGLYVFPSVPAGNYLIVVEHAGFKKFEGKLPLRVGQEAIVDVNLVVATESVTVEVRDESPVIETSSGTISSNLESERIRTLPLNGRELTSLFTLTPGVTRQGGTQVNGLQTGSVMFLGDGISMEDRYTGDMSRVNPALEGIQEFRIETLNSSAQYSKPATISYITKSGTNLIHGSAFLTYRSNAFYARDPFSQNDQPPLQRREFGASAGGPVYIPKVYDGKDKTFFFFTYEGLRQPQFNTYHVGSPPQEIRDGDFSNYIPYGESSVFKIYDPLTTRLDPATGTYVRDQFPNNIIPADRISNLAKQALPYYPLPNVAGAALDQNLETHLSAGTDRNKYTTKIDQQFSKDTISGSYTFTDEKRDNPRGGVSEEIYFNKVTARTWQVTLSETHIFSPTIVNELRLGGTRPNSRRGPTIKDPAITDVLGLQNATGDTGWPCLYSYTPAVNLEFGSFYYDDDNPQTAPQAYITVADNLSWTKKNHAFRMGGQFRHNALNSNEIGQPRGCYEFPADWTALAGDPSGVWAPGTGSGFASFLLGYPLAGELRTNKGFFYHRQKDFSFYFQDDWKFSPRLTLNLGLRYEYYTRYKELNDQIASYDPVTKSMVTSGPIEQAYQVNAAAIQAYEDAGVVFKSASEVGFPSGLFTPDRNDFAPRIGFAYALDNNGTTVIRGGYGISFWTFPLITLQARSRTNPPFDFRRLMVDYPPAYDYSGVGQKEFTTTTPPYVLGGDTLAFDDTQLRIGVPVSMAPFDPNMKDSMAQSWNLTVERQLFSRTGLRLSYVGTKGSNLQIQEPINSLAPASTMPGVTTQDRRANPVYGNIDTLKYLGDSSSHQFQAEVHRNMSRGLTFQAFYAWNRSINTSDYGAGSASALAILGDRQSGIASFDDRLRLERATSSSYPIHQFTFNFLYDLPFGPSQRWGASTNGVVSRIIGGWQMAAIGGMRSGLFTTYANRNQPGYAQVADPNLPRDQQTVDRYFDTTAFVRFAGVDTITAGRPGRDNIVGPGFRNVDFSIFKNTQIVERLNLRLTMDIFNVFNHPSWGMPNTTTGRITSMASSPRLFQFGARVEF